MYFVLRLNFILFLLAFSSCSYLEKLGDDLKGRNQIIGVGSDEIENKNIDDDQKGSDSNSISGFRTVFFSFDSSSLSKEVKDILRANQAWMQENSSVVRLELEGHCDPLGSEAYNIGLGQRRAESVKRFLISLGMNENQLSIISYGEEKPLSSVDNKLNRRVNFVPIY